MSTHASNTGGSAPAAATMATSVVGGQPPEKRRRASAAAAGPLALDFTMDASEIETEVARIETQLEADLARLTQGAHA
jgi:hypothetical protein